MAGGWRTSPIVRVRPKSTCSPFRTCGGGHWQVSTAGGSQPLWSKNTKELFYVGANGTLLGVPVEASGATWNNGTPTKLLEARYLTAGDASGGRNVRCVARRPAVPDDQRTRDRRGRSAASTHRRAALGRGAEAPRADEIGWRCPSAQGSARTRSFPRSAPAGWARSIAPATRS